MNTPAPGGAESRLVDLNHLIHGRHRARARRLARTLKDVPSYLHLARRLELKSLTNLLYTKTILPTGEGFHLGLAARLPRRPDEVPIPAYIEMETTTLCNKRCVICEYVHWPKKDQERRHLTLDEFRHVVDQFPVLRWVNLTGEGSSFLNPDYPSMLAYLHEKHATSIWLVDHLCDTNIEFLRERVFPHIHGIYVSLDGATKETYESIRKGCSFDAAIGNLREIVRFKRQQRSPLPHLAFRYIILKENVAEIPQFLDLLNSMAAPREWGGSSSSAEFAGLLSFKEIEHHYVDRVPRDIVDQLKQRTEGIPFFFSHAEEASNPPIERCRAWLQPYVMLPGYVLPCCAVLMSNRRPFLRRYAFGNVFEEPFSRIWNNEYYLQFRRTINDPTKPVPQLCAGCRAFRTAERIERHGVWDIHG